MPEQIDSLEICQLFLNTTQHNTTQHSATKGRRDGRAPFVVVRAGHNCSSVSSGPLPPRTKASKGVCSCAAVHVSQYLVEWFVYLCVRIGIACRDRYCICASVRLQNKNIAHGLWALLLGRHFSPNCYSAEYLLFSLFSFTAHSIHSVFFVLCSLTTFFFVLLCFLALQLSSLSSINLQRNTAQRFNPKEPKIRNHVVVRVIYFKYHALVLFLDHHHSSLLLCCSGICNQVQE